MMEDGNGRKKVWICLSIGRACGGCNRSSVLHEYAEGTLGRRILIRRESEDCADGIRENALY